MAELHAGAQALRYLQMLDRNFRVTCPQPKITTLVPARRAIRVQRQCAIGQHDHGANILAKGT
jgi:hypothetical protein